MEPESKPEQTIGKIKWFNAKRKVSSLRFHPQNPRIITEKSLGEMEKSIDEFGFASGVLINADNMIIAGHKSVSALLDKNRGDEEIDVRIPSRLLSPEEHLKFLLMHNHIGDNGWDWDKMHNEIDAEMLRSAGFTEDQLAGFAGKVEKETEELEKQLAHTNEITCPECGAKFTQ